MLLWNKLKATGRKIMCIGNKQNKNITQKILNNMYLVHIFELSTEHITL